MAFSEETKAAAYRRAGGKCECAMKHCGHSGRCNKPLGSNWHTSPRSFHRCRCGNDI